MPPLPWLITAVAEPLFFLPCVGAVLNRQPGHWIVHALHEQGEANAEGGAPADDKPSTRALQQMVARHLLDPATTIPTDNAKLRSAVSPAC